MSATAMIPGDMADRLAKAQGHVNAANRRLWEEVDRGLWSAHQAMARMAEIWLRLSGDTADLPPVEKYLARDVMHARLDALGRIAKSAPLDAAWTELKAAEAAIRSSSALSPLDEEGTAAEMDRSQGRRFLEALDGLRTVVEAEIAARYVTLQAGEWVRLHDGRVGHVMERRDLRALLLIPATAVTAPSQGIRSYALQHGRIERIDCPQPVPITSAAYYWLVEAERRWSGLSNTIITTDWLTLRGLCYNLKQLLDACAKAWWVTVDPAMVLVVDPNGDPRHVRLLPGTAPAAMADPLFQALDRADRVDKLASAAMGASSPASSAEAYDEAVASLGLAREALDATEDLLEHGVDLVPGQWVEVLDRGHGRITFRTGRDVVVDLGEAGVLATSLFATAFYPIDRPSDWPDLPPDRQRARWLWFAGHTAACFGRGVCPCCGLPGVGPEGVCALCGWEHDGRSFDPHRSCRRNAGLDLALGRRRFAALGYAVPVADTPAGYQDAWLDPFVLAAKRRLVAAFDDLARHGSDETGSRLDHLHAQWQAWEDRLASCLRRKATGCHRPGGRS